MTEPKFTPKPWQRIGMKVCDAEGFTIAKCGWISQSDEEAMANGDLLAAAPELYENEEKNLKSFRESLEFYKSALPNLNAIAKIVVQEIITGLETRIAETEQVLAKARGGKDNADE